MEAYREAVAQQADWIELDVHLLADGALGVYHDNALPTGELMADLLAEDLRPTSRFWAQRWMHQKVASSTSR